MNKTYTLVVLTIVLTVAVTLMGCAQQRPRVCRSTEIWNGEECTSIAELKSACSSLPDDQEALCSQVLDRRQEMFQAYSAGRDLSADNQKYLGARVYAYAAEVPRSLEKHNSKVKYICKLRDNGKIHCTELSSLLAFYTTEMNMAIVSDLALLYATHEHLNSIENTLVNCGQGVWGSTDISEARTRTLSEDDRWPISGLCEGLERIDVAGEDFRDSGMAAGIIGPSGISGFDPFSGYCGLDIEGTGLGERFFDQTLEYIEAMHEQCETTLAGSMMEKQGEGTEGLPGGSKDKKIETAREITQNGDGTETVTDVDGDGNVVTGTRPSTQAGDSVDVQYTDGSSGHSSSTPTGDGGMTYVESTTTADGKTTTTTTHVDADGNVSGETTWDDGSTSDLPPLWAPPTHPMFVPVPKDCGSVDGDACSNCVAFNGMTPKLVDACLGADFMLCRSFGLAASCCSDPDSFPADPRVVLPNPMGDFYCADSQDLDTQKERCDALCSVAYHEDCYSSCMSSMQTELDWSMMDAVCLYAVGDWCFGDDFVDDISGQEPGLTGTGEPQPVPPPVDMSTYMILPPGSDDGSITFPP